MDVKDTRIKFFTCACLLALMLCSSLAGAQQLKYSRQNVFVGTPHDLQFVANLSGNHHLLSVNNDEAITIFIYNNSLELKKKLATPFKFPDDAQLKIISFADYYYLNFYHRQAKKNMLWKIDANGNCSEYSLALEELLETQVQHIESGFQLTERKGQLCLMYHTYIPQLEKNVLTMLQVDTGLQITQTKKVMYELKESGERLLQEQIISDKYLLILKTTTGGTALKLMKMDIGTGLSVSKDFYSAGLYFSQPQFMVSDEDSTIHVLSTLTEPQKLHSRKNYVFTASLNSMLEEKVPFTLLKKQFRKNTGTNFVLVNKKSGWVRLRTSWGLRYNVEPVNWIAPSTGIPSTTKNAYQRLGDFTEEQLEGVRFSMLNNNLNISSDSLIGNNKNAFTIRPSQFTQFETDQKNYLLIAQVFFGKRNGLSMVSAKDNQQLSYTQLPVIGHYDYLLHLAKKIPQQIIIPYRYKLEAGLIRIAGN